MSGGAPAWRACALRLRDALHSLCRAGGVELPLQTTRESHLSYSWSKRTQQKGQATSSDIIPTCPWPYFNLANTCFTSLGTVITCVRDDGRLPCRYEENEDMWAKIKAEILGESDSDDEDDDDEDDDEEDDGAAQGQPQSQMTQQVDGTRFLVIVFVQHRQYK